MHTGWYLWDSGPANAALNMGLDEALLENPPLLGRPILRFYSWAEPAASFGYAQRYAEVAQWTELRPLVRRPTGGGLVPHDRDWTYSLVFPAWHPWYALPAVESYQHLHEWLRAAFERVSVPTTLSPAREKEVPGRCFVGAERFDLLWREQKIAGAAQRRTRHGLLIQGSVRPPPQVNRAEWQQAVAESGGQNFGIVWEAWRPPIELIERARELAAHKYSQPAFTQRR